MAPWATSWDKSARPVSRIPPGRSLPIASRWRWMIAPSRIDPNFLRAKRGLAITRMKIGSVEMETDPAEALKEFQAALQRADALPKAEQDSLPAVRLRDMLLRKQANAFERLGEYAQAVPLFEQALEISQRIACPGPEGFPGSLRRSNGAGR